jgi:UDP-MurNAc hydroxylase
MQITFLGQAGLFVETRKGTVLCDPWFNPAFFASWFPFPSNEGIDRQMIGRPDYLYVSHLHHDHFDEKFLADHVWKEATILLPDYPIDHLEKELRRLGFTKFVHTKSGQPVDVDGLRFAILALVAPTDGPIGDSALMIDDGQTRIFNQNDSHPIDLDGLRALGPFDAHFLQFSGGIWYPMVYDFPRRMKEALGRKKRINQQARAFRYVQQIDAANVFPSAGPPCYLDDDLFYLNDTDRDPTNIFCDQTVFMEYMREHDNDRGQLIVPDSVIELEGTRSSVRHPMSDQEVQAIFDDKQAYLAAYKARQQPVIDTIKAGWPRGQIDILSSLQEWFEPLLGLADLTCRGVNSRVLLDCDTDKVVIDFLDRKVRAWDGEYCRYRFRIAPELVESCIDQRLDDWVNELFLSCRFKAERDGAYNEYVYNFFKCLSPERLEYAEGYYEEQSPVAELWQCDGYMIQRRCPHLKADLTRFAQVEDGILTCTMHGWQFDLATGRCLTSDDRKLYTEPVTAKAEQPA